MLKNINNMLEHKLSLDRCRVEVVRAPAPLADVEDEKHGARRLSAAPTRPRAGRQPPRLSAACLRAGRGASPPHSAGDALAHRTRVRCSAPRDTRPPLAAPRRAPPGTFNRLRTLFCCSGVCYSRCPRRRAHKSARSRLSCATLKAASAATCLRRLPRTPRKIQNYHSAR